MSLHSSLRHLALTLKNPFMKLDIFEVHLEFTDIFQFWFEHDVQYRQLAWQFSASSLVSVNIYCAESLVEEIGKFVALETTESVVFMYRNCE